MDNRAVRRDAHSRNRLVLKVKGPYSYADGYRLDGLAAGKMSEMYLVYGWDVYELVSARD